MRKTFCIVFSAATFLLLVLTVGYLTAAVISAALHVVPMEVFLWGGLILLLAWVGQDRIGEWMRSAWRSH